MESTATLDREPEGLASLRVFLVVALALFSLFASVPDIVLPWHPTAEFGLSIDAAGGVLEVRPHSPAARANIVAGDTVDFSATPFEYRRYLNSGAPNNALAGTSARFVIGHGGTERTVDLVAEVTPRSFADNFTDILAVGASIAIILISAFLVLKRPSKMTWAFFLFANGQLFASTTFAILPPEGVVALLVVGGIFGVPWLWLAIFALRFPSDKTTGWRRSAERALLYSLPLLLPLSVWGSAGILFGKPAPAALDLFFGALDVAGLAFVAAVFLLTYMHATPDERARIRWVMLGLVIGFGAEIVWQIGSSVPGLAVAFPLWLFNLTQSAQIAIALTVAYAIVRNRIFDVRFFIGRAVVYGALTTGVVATLALVESAAERVLEGTRLAVLGEAGLAVVVGLSLNTVHKVLERFVDRTLFRSRIDAQRRLSRVTRGLSHATSLEAIEYVVVHEPAEAFKLTSAAIFRREHSGDFFRGESIGWDHATLDSIGSDDPLVLQLLGSKEPLPIRDVGLPPDALPAGLKHPVFVLPMVVRSDLVGILFYGPHSSQENIDPSEMETLERLVLAAASAHDHAHAELLQKKVTELEREVEDLRLNSDGTLPVQSSIAGSMF
jgi:hypothetical protein